MEQFGKYTLIRKIGTGGMAEVFLARTTVAQGLNKTLVIKKIHTAYAKSRQFVAMFVDEAKIALGLNHPNIVQVFDFGAVADTYFLAMEHVEGVDLLRLLQEAAKARQRLPYGLSAYIVQQVARGLDYAHRKSDDFGRSLGIVHRDVSPQNILLSWDGSVKIVDFGIARARDVHEEDGVIKGKYAYMSPEQARGEPVDCRSDVFAAGIVLFELVCARPLFHGRGKGALDMVKSGSIPRPSESAPELPESLERIILRALAFDRADRFATARELQHELGKFQLEWGQKAGALIDSGALAHVLTRLIPDERMVAQRPPAEGGARGRADDDASDAGEASEPSESDAGDGGEASEPDVTLASREPATLGGRPWRAAPQGLAEVRRLATPAAAAAAAATTGAAGGAGGAGAAAAAATRTAGATARGTAGAAGAAGAAGTASTAGTPAGSASATEPARAASPIPSGGPTTSSATVPAMPGAPFAAGSRGSTPSHAPSPTPGPDVRRDPRERKHVYVLEGVIRGLPALERKLGTAGAARLVQQFYEMARDVAFKHDAMLDQPRLPPDGSVGVAARAPAPFGHGSAPGGDATLRVVLGLPLASEGDAGRAIRLALALVDALDGIGSDVEPELRLALAVQRGVALVKRAPTSPTAKSPAKPPARPRGPVFDIEEATAAFAHKLAENARGAEILVGGRVFRAARAEWSFEPLPAIDLPDESPSGTTATRGQLDDETDPGVKRARVYRLRGPKERSQRLREHRNTGRLYGRDLELKALRDAWRDVLVTRRKRQIVIVGDAGVGKRTLVRNFLSGVSPAEAIVVRTSARIGTAMTPYGVIADLARDVLGLAEHAEPHEVERRLARELPQLYAGEETSRAARSAHEILGLLLGARGEAPHAEIDAETRRQTLIQLLVRVEQRLEPGKPLVLFGEDMHWADQDSQRLFAALLKMPTLRPIFGLMTSRPEPRILALAKELGTEVVLLDELPDATRREMLSERLVPGPDADELVEQIAKRCGGNAFFIQELLDALIERGVLVPDRDDQEHPGLLRWVMRDAPIQVPSTVEDLILSRIDMLPHAAREAIMYAAVLGREVAAPALESLLARPVQAELDELVRRGLLSPRPDLDEYRFKNDMTMTVAYGLLSPETRVQLHRSVAARLAGAPGYRPGQDDALIARHLELAGDEAPAAERYLRAASHAVELAGNADAFRQLSRALVLLPAQDHERRFAAHRLREEILRRLARRPQQLREIHALRKQAELIGDPGKLALAHTALAQFYIDVGKAPAALRAAAPAQDYARLSGDALREAEALRLRAAIARLVGNADESLRLIDQALALCDPGSPDGNRPRTQVLLARATILDQRGTTLWNIGRLEAALESYAEALVIYRAIGMGRLEARALSHMGIVFAALGEFEEALAHGKSALKLDQSLGDRAGIALQLGNIGQCYADLGDLDRADSYLSKALKIADQTGDLAAAAHAAVSWGQARLWRGHGAAALALFERGLALATDNRDRYQQIRAQQYVALAHLALGNPPDTALELARSATEWARKMPMLVGIIHGLAFQGLALSRLGRHGEAIACVDEAVELLEGARPEGAEHIHRWRAEVLTAAGKRDAAREAAVRAAAEVEVKAAKLRDPELRRLFVASRQLG